KTLSSFPRILRALFPSSLSLNNISLALAASSSSSSRSASHHASPRLTFFFPTVTIDFSVGSRDGKVIISLKFLKERSSLPKLRLLRPSMLMGREIISQSNRSVSSSQWYLKRVLKHH
ncbi:unnamed protein product, partial [Brassica rapa subsp. trilocularis]